ncbi:MAG: rhodanese-like domain-containing protein [Gammaproteobacteria bacterium]|nr:rhodanese-like domain-containing protein [Gammaproteobacteria bacterium]
MNDFLAFVIQYWALWLATALLVVLILYFEIREHAHGINQLSAQEVVRWMNHERAVVVDVREAHVFAEGHIVGSINLPFKQMATELTSLEKYKEKPLILICQAGIQALKAAKLLRRHGFKQVVALKGGLGAWRVASLPLKKGK